MGGTERARRAGSNQPIGIQIREGRLSLGSPLEDAAHARGRRQSLLPAVVRPLEVSAFMYPLSKEAVIEIFIGVGIKCVWVSN